MIFLATILFGLGFAQYSFAYPVLQFAPLSLPPDHNILDVQLSTSGNFLSVSLENPGGRTGQNLGIFDFSRPHDPIWLGKSNSVWAHGFLYFEDRLVAWTAGNDFWPGEREIFEQRGEPSQVLTRQLQVGLVSGRERAFPRGETQRLVLHSVESGRAKQTSFIWPNRLMLERHSFTRSGDEAWRVREGPTHTRFFSHTVFNGAQYHQTAMGSTAEGDHKMSKLITARESTEVESTSPFPLQIFALSFSDGRLEFINEDASSRFYHHLLVEGGPGSAAYLTRGLRYASPVVDIAMPGSKPVRQLALVHENGQLRVIDPITGARIRMVEVPGGASNVAYGWDPDLLVIGSKNGGIYREKGPDGALEEVSPSPSSEWSLTQLDFSPSYRAPLVAATWENQTGVRLIRVLDPRTGEIIAEVPNGIKVEFSQYGTWFVTVTRTAIQFHSSRSRFSELELREAVGRYSAKLEEWEVSAQEGAVTHGGSHRAAVLQRKIDRMELLVLLSQARAAGWDLARVTEGVSAAIPNATAVMPGYNDPIALVGQVFGSDPPTEACREALNPPE